MGLICVIVRISWRSVKSLLSYPDLTAFNMAAVRHLGFLHIQNFNGRYDQ